MIDVAASPVGRFAHRRWRTVVGAGLLSGLLIISVAAVTAPGLVKSKVTMHDGGMWQVDRARARVGHINGGVDEVDAELRHVDWAGVALNVEQSDTAIAVVDTFRHQFWLIDDRLGQIDNPVSYPIGAQVLAAGQRLAIVDGVGGRVWLFDQSVPASGADLSGVAPTGSVMQGAVAAIGLDGTLHMAAPGSDVVEQIDPQGAVTRNSAPDAFSKALQISAVGEITTVLDAKDGGVRLTVANAGKVSQRLVPTLAPGNLQIPGSDGTAVLVAGGGALNEVSLADASVSRLVTDLPDDLLGPAVLGPCVVAASPRTGEVASRCRGDAWKRVAPLVGGHRLKMRIVNGRIWIDDLDGSDAIRVSSQGAEQNITRWSDSVSAANGGAPTEADTGGGRQAKDNGGSSDGAYDSTSNAPPVPTDDVAVIRPNRSSALSVLANDADPDGDPLRLDQVDSVPAGISVELINNATAVQVRTARIGQFSFRYQAGDGHVGHARWATVAVTVDDVVNKPPVVRGERVLVRPGGRVELDLLANDFDPEGDALSMTVGDLSPSVGVVSSFAGGRIQVVAAPAAAGVHTVTYQVTDDRGASTTGRLELEFTADANNAPSATDDVVVAVVGSEVQFDPRTNDHDIDGDPLIVSGIPATVRVGRTVFGPDGGGRFIAAAVGTSVVRYTLSDGAQESSASIRFDVVAAGANHAPVPVDDRLLIQASGRVTVAPLANDTDPDGDVLSISTWTADPSIAVEPTPAGGFSIGVAPNFTAGKITYTATDGIESAEAQIYVRRVPEASNQPPVARNDETRVRVGVVRSVDVRANDSDPESGPLTLVSVTSSDPVSAIVSLADNKINVEGKVATDAAIKVSYIVRDDLGATATAVLFVDVIGDSSPNRSPVALPDVARAIVGNAVVIPVLANDGDPDGDVLSVSSVAAVPDAVTRVSADRRSVIFEQLGQLPGTVRFSYTVTDDRGAKATSTVALGMFAVPVLNRPPVAAPDAYSVVAGSGDTVFDVLANDSDPDGDRITLRSVTASSDVNAVVAGSRVRFTAPNNAASAPVSFQYSIDDGRGGSGTGNVSVTVRASKAGAPKAVDDVFTVRSNSVSELAVLRNDSDPDGPQSELRVVSVDGPGLSVSADRRQVLVKSGGVNIKGSYIVRDNPGNEASASISVLIQSPGTAPAALAPTVPRPVAAGTTVAPKAPSPTSPAATRTTTTRRPAVTISGPGVPVSSLRPTVAPTPTTSTVNQRISAVDDEVSIRPGTTLVVDPLANDDPSGRLTLVAVDAPGRITDNATKVEISVAKDARNTLELRYTVELRGDGPTTRASAIIRVRVSGLPPQMVPPVAVVRKTSIVVSWLTPQSSSPIDLYEVRVSGDATPARQTGGTEITFTDFPGGRVYRFEVRAHSSEGWGDWSAPSAQVVLRQKITALAAPIVKADDHRLLISWTAAPSDVDRYRLSMVGTAEIREITAPTSYIWEGLTNGKGYSFVVVAVNEAGESDPSAASIVTKPAGKPGSPIGLSAVLVGKRQVRVRWQAADDNGSPIVKYALSGCGSADATADTRELLSTVASTKNLTCRLVATNGVGAGVEATAKVLAQGAIGTPKAPVAVRGDEKVSLTWTEPDSSADIDGYRLESDTSLGTRTSTGTSFEWPSLTNGTPYRFRVRALSDGEEGPWSDYSVAVTPAGKPSVPRKLVAAPTDVTGRLSFSWQAPASTGGVPIAEYRYRCATDGAQPSVVTESGPVTVVAPINEPLKGWSCALLAVNTAGLVSPVVSVDVDPANGPVTAAPANLGATVVGTTASLRWSAPVSGWAPYQYVVSRSGARDIVTTATSVDVKNLGEGKSYDFTVVAVSALGKGQGASVVAVIPVPTTTTTSTTVPVTTTTSSTVPATTTTSSTTLVTSTTSTTVVVTSTSTTVAVTTSTAAATTVAATSSTAAPTTVAAATTTVGTTLPTKP